MAAKSKLVKSHVPSFRELCEENRKLHEKKYKGNWKILRGAKQAFFKAMLAGYIGKRKSRRLTKTKGTDGSTTIEFPWGRNYKVVDKYYTCVGSDNSSGTTIILYRGRAVWWMSYGGAYEKRAIPFLKETLSKMYEQGRFRGGRGVEERRTETMVYTNQLHQPGNSNFTCFSGIEVIHGKEVGPLGYHRYMGEALLDAGGEPI